MKKFKLFFYPVYLITAILVLYYSIDILANMDSYKEKIDFTMLRKLPQYFLYLLLMVSLLMIIELVAENLHLIRLRKKVRQSEKDLLQVKAKLYDRTQLEPEPADDDDEEEDEKLTEEQEDEDNEDIEDDEDEDEYKLG